MPLLEHLPPKYLLCTHPRGNPQPTALQVSGRQAVRLISLPELDFGCGQLLLPVLSWASLS